MHTRSNLSDLLLDVTVLRAHCTYWADSKVRSYHSLHRLGIFRKMSNNRKKGKKMSSNCVNWIYVWAYVTFLSGFSVAQWLLSQSLVLQSVIGSSVSQWFLSQSLVLQSVSGSSVAQWFLRQSVVPFTVKLIQLRTFIFRQVALYCLHSDQPDIAFLITASCWGKRNNKRKTSLLTTQCNDLVSTFLTAD